MNVNLPEVVLRHMLQEYQQGKVSEFAKDEYRKILEKAGLIESEPKVYKTYTVTVNFAGFIGYDNDYEVDADSEEDAIIQAEEMAKDDLEVVEIEQTDDHNEWQIGVCFCGMSNGTEYYDIYAENEGEAVSEAIETAAADLSGEITNIEDWGE